MATGCVGRLGESSSRAPSPGTTLRIVPRKDPGEPGSPPGDLWEPQGSKHETMRSTYVDLSSRRFDFTSMLFDLSRIRLDFVDSDPEIGINKQVTLL